MGVWAILIPGLAMLANEFSVQPGVVVLENPNMGRHSQELGESYSLDDVAKVHLATILELTSLNEPLKLFGFSMGGMVLSILATKYRDQLPKDTEFIYLMTSSNSSSLPAITEEQVSQWFQARPGNVQDFKKALSPLFSKNFRENFPDVTQEYFKYRAYGGNAQDPAEFVRQMNAIQTFLGDRYFQQIDSSESIFIGGKGDEVLGPKHNSRLRELQPLAEHYEVLSLGHMIHLEFQYDKNLNLPSVCQELLSRKSEGE